MGRPSKYNNALGERICKELISGKSLRSICRKQWAPAMSTVFGWLASEDHPFSEQYKRARKIQAEGFIDEVIEIADHGGNGDPRRARLMVDTRKWVASKVLPKVYGDRILGADGGPLTIRLVKEDESL